MIRQSAGILALILGGIIASGLVPFFTTPLTIWAVLTLALIGLLLLMERSFTHYLSSVRQYQSIFASKTTLLDLLLEVIFALLAVAILQGITTLLTAIGGQFPSSETLLASAGLTTMKWILGKAIAVLLGGILLLVVIHGLFRSVAWSALLEQPWSVRYAWIWTKGSLAAIGIATTVFFVILGSLRSSLAVGVAPLVGVVLLLFLNRFHAELTHTAHIRSSLKTAATAIIHPKGTDMLALLAALWIGITWTMLIEQFLPITQQSTGILIYGVFVFAPLTTFLRRHFLVATKARVSENSHSVK